jgi:membrane carboxypeptidase/penicillin-binding protein
MANWDNRASRRRAYFIEDAVDVLKKIALRIAIVLIFVVLMLGVGLWYAHKVTPRAINKMRSEPLSMKVSELTGEQLAELILVCDPDFYTHRGVSLHAPGFRTIPHRLAEQYYFKGYQAWLEMPVAVINAWTLNRHMPKDEQLLIFVNNFDFGLSREHDVRGFQEAAHYFYDKKFRELNRDEYLSILATLTNPEKYHIQGEALANIERTKRIKNMLDGKCKASSVFDVELKNCK